MRRTTLYRMLAILAAFALVVAACGDDDADTTTTGADTTTTGAPTPTVAEPPPTTAPTGGPTPTAPRTAADDNGDELRRSAGDHARGF